MTAVPATGPPRAFKTVAQVIKVIAPNGNEAWIRGKPYWIRWNENLTENVSVDLYRGGVFVRPCYANSANPGAVQWTLGTVANLPAANTYSIRIKSYTNPTTLYDDSDSYFSVVELGDPTSNQAPLFTAYAVNATTGQPLSLYPAKILAPGQRSGRRCGHLDPGLRPQRPRRLRDAWRPASTTPRPPTMSEPTPSRWKSPTPTAPTFAGSSSPSTWPPRTQRGGPEPDQLHHLIDGKADMVFRGIPGRSYTHPAEHRPDQLERPCHGHRRPDGKIMFTDPSPPVPNGFLSHQVQLTPHVPGLLNPIPTTSSDEIDLSINCGMRPDSRPVLRHRGHHAGLSTKPVNTGDSRQQRQRRCLGHPSPLPASAMTFTYVEVPITTHNGWNGDLYAYLEHDGVISVLLNRPRPHQRRYRRRGIERYARAPVGFRGGGQPHRHPRHSRHARHRHLSARRP